MDRVLFRDAIKVGGNRLVLGIGHYTGRTSLEVGIRVDTENIQDGTRRHTNSCYFTMVAVDDTGTGTGPATGPHHRPERTGLPVRLPAGPP